MVQLPATSIDTEHYSHLSASVIKQYTLVLI